jgi:hypothetical protein
MIRPKYKPSVHFPITAAIFMTGIALCVTNNILKTTYIQGDISLEVYSGVFRKTVFVKIHDALYDIIKDNTCQYIEYEEYNISYKSLFCQHVFGVQMFGILSILLAFIQALLFNFAANISYDVASGYVYTRVIAITILAMIFMDLLGHVYESESTLSYGMIISTLYIILNYIDCYNSLVELKYCEDLFAMNFHINEQDEGVHPDANQ